VAKLARRLVIGAPKEAGLRMLNWRPKENSPNLHGRESSLVTAPLARASLAELKLSGVAPKGAHSSRWELLCLAHSQPMGQALFVSVGRPLGHTLKQSKWESPKVWPQFWSGEQFKCEFDRISRPWILWCD